MMPGQQPQPMMQQPYGQPDPLQAFIALLHSFAFQQSMGGGGEAVSPGAGAGATGGGSYGGGGTPGGGSGGVGSIGVG